MLSPSESMIRKWLEKTNYGIPSMVKVLHEEMKKFCELQSELDVLFKEEASLAAEHSRQRSLLRQRIKKVRDKCNHPEFFTRFNNEKGRTETVCEVCGDAQ